MKKIVNFGLIIGLILSAGACSSSQTNENGEEVLNPDALAATDAGTDAVPQEGTEAVAADPSVDPNSAPPADAAVAQEGAVPPADAPPADAQTQAVAESQPPVDPATPPQDAVAQADTQGVVEPSPAGSGQFEDYQVAQGDTLMKIAFETYGDLYRWKSILDANKDKIADPNNIPSGTVLKIEKPATPVSIAKNGEKYLIKSGDTLGTISNDVYGTRAKWRVLWENNRQLIHDPNKIFAGFYLYYQPQGSMPAQDTPPEFDQQPLAGAGTGPGKVLPGANTATTTGDTARAPASADGVPPAQGVAPQTATQ